MDLETGRARWIVLGLLLCFFAAAVPVLRHYEGQRGAGQEDEGQGAWKTGEGQEQEAYSEPLQVGVLLQIGELPQQRIRLYQEEDRLFLFLPAADAVSVRWDFDETRYELAMPGGGGEGRIGNGDVLSWPAGKEDREEKLRIRDIRRGEEAVYRLCPMRSERLPAIFISTESGTMDWIHADKRNRESGELLCVDAQGVPAYAGAMSRLSGRGNSSWAEDKRSYSVTLAQAAGLAGMPEAEKWILQANALDATRMRNKLTYDMARDLGLQYAIDSAYADVWLNGVYAGNYLVCEKIETGENRVDITSRKESWEEDGRYTRTNEGAWWEYESDHERREGYLLEFNDRIGDDKAGYFFAGDRQVEVRSPGGLTGEEYAYISAYARKTVECLQNAAQSDEYLEYIDLESWSLLFLINELTNDTDANRYSVFYYKDKDTKLFAGPVWDYDIAWGNDFLGRDVRCSFFRIGWYGTLYDNDVFYRSVTELYKTRMKPVLEAYLDRSSGHIDEICGQIRRSVEMDDIRWAHSGGYTRRSSERDWEKAVDVLRDYMQERMAFYDDVWLSGETWHRVLLHNGDTVVAVTYVRDADTVPDTLLSYVAECLAQNSWRTEKGGGL